MDCVSVVLAVNATSNHEAAGRRPKERLDQTSSSYSLQPKAFSLTVTLEPDGTATGCNPVQVGSTPTGVSYESTAVGQAVPETVARFTSKLVDGASAGGALCTAFAGSRGVFRQRVLKVHRRLLLAQLVRAPDLESGSRGFDSRTEHQPVGSQPTPETRKRYRPLARGRRALDRSAPVGDACLPGRVSFENHLRMGEERTLAQRHVSGRGSTNECHEVRGYRFLSPLASGRRSAATRHRTQCRQAVTTRPTNRRQPEAQASLRIPTCDRLTSRRLKASNNKKTREIRTGVIRDIREKAGFSTVSADNTEESSLFHVQEKNSFAWLTMTMLE